MQILNKTVNLGVYYSLQCAFKTRPGQRKRDSNIWPRPDSLSADKQKPNIRRRPTWGRRWKPRPSVRCATSWPWSPSLSGAITASVDAVSVTCGAFTRTARTAARSGGVKPCTRPCRWTTASSGRTPPVAGAKLPARQVARPDPAGRCVWYWTARDWQLVLMRMLAN